MPSHRKWWRQNWNLSLEDSDTMLSVLSVGARKGLSSWSMCSLPSSGDWGLNRGTGLGQVTQKDRDWSTAQVSRLPTPFFCPAPAHPGWPWPRPHLPVSRGNYWYLEQRIVLSWVPGSCVSQMSLVLSLNWWWIIRTWPGQAQGGSRLPT